MANSFLSDAELRNEAPMQVSRRELIFVIGLVAAFVGLANLMALITLDRWSPNLGYSIVKSKWHHLLTLSEPVDWLVLGDSSGNQGVEPSVLERQLGGRAINLATIAGTVAVNDAWMLARYLERFLPPRAVVLVHAYDVWHREFETALLAEVPLPWGYWKAMRPTVQVGAERTLRVAAYRYAPLYTHNDSLVMLMRGWVDPRQRPRLTEEGFMEVPDADPALVDLDMNDHLVYTDRRSFRMSEDNRAALSEIRALANRYGFDVFLVNSPLYDELYQRPTFRAFYEQVSDVLSAWAGSDPHLHYVFRQPMLFPRTSLQTVDHLTTEGAHRFSRALGAEIARFRSPVVE